MSQRKIYEKKTNKHKEKRSRGRSCRKLIMSFLLKAWFMFRYHFDLIVNYIFGLYYNSSLQYIPKVQDPLLLESAISLAEKIRKKEVKAETVVQAFINRIKEVNYLLNALVDDRFKAALKEAQEIDTDIKNGKITEVDFMNKPFLGVPFIVKESTSCKGLSNTFGLVSRQGKTAKEDADVVVSMKNAGAILLGVSNVPQLNMWQETHNPVYGITKNPYNTSRNVGGSSGGDAALVAACGTPMAIGTDIGGSIRIPAFKCGVFGHKPTCNLISLKGLTFRTGKEISMVVPGPIVKKAEDLGPILKVLVGLNSMQLKLEDPVDISKVGIYYVIDPEDPFVSPIRADMKDLMNRVIGHLTGVSVDPPQKVELENLKYGGIIWRFWVLKELYPNFFSHLNEEAPVNPYVEIIKFFLRLSTYTFATIFNLINCILPHPNPEWTEKVTNELKTEILVSFNIKLKIDIKQVEL
ncbi:fatty-acid amide hydrolase 2-A-like [Agrilus planipennis]|uniref:Fatty-acid amide hydrolase 2-A-like n=1 Tax=Agrilus planipennis TaxID=224129 RepID=A0A7F5QWS0_AGRPL|nr:fatty-acid amide hydrolase 2-A-like [Agrilus planipennis]XP_025829591.1 fatty-acid amide hydrolase 2-A-like [Agrilus planipennis]